MRWISLALPLLILIGCSSSPVNRAQWSELRLMPTSIRSLGENLPEGSGLALHNQTLWSINDGGNDPILYGFDLTDDSATKVEKVTLRNAANLDWESLITTSEALVIADCGNNRGDRIWFQFHSISWDQLEESQGLVDANTINVKLADVTPAVERQDHNRDCEAVTEVDGNYWLFTKNWRDQKSRLYIVDPNSDQQSVSSHQSFDVAGLITGADYDAKSRRLALIGYGSGFAVTQPFIWIVPVYQGEAEFDQAVRYSLAKMGQWEAIHWYQGHLLISRETSPLGGALLAEVKLPTQMH
ncbi:MULTISPECIES: hypothetical protein [unclassified Marinobacterium]|jgi:hypothetical protein|uniref:hypothetical protein n=1 Tax=unclassified Marinobacterium TaxID=2644139 RepID=UPI0015690543|nr:MULTISPECIES: hypothetical protein [unclassified Marinobacterium]